MLLGSTNKACKDYTGDPNAKNGVSWCFLTSGLVFFLEKYNMKKCFTNLFLYIYIISHYVCVELFFHIQDINLYIVYIYILLHQTQSA